MLLPRKPVTELKAPSLKGKEFDIASASAERFIMLVFYRGYHCPQCRLYLGELSKIVEEFEERGVTTFVLSSDTAERAKKTADEWNISHLNIVYDVSIDMGRSWGLFVSTSRGKTSTGIMEPDVFLEPGLFLVRPDKTLYASNIQTMPFARPNFQALLKSVDFIIEKDYPARGELQA